MSSRTLKRMMSNGTQSNLSGRTNEQAYIDNIIPILENSRKRGFSKMVLRLDNGDRLILMEIKDILSIERKELGLYAMMEPQAMRSKMEPALGVEE